MVRLKVAEYKRKTIDFQQFNLDTRWSNKSEAMLRARFLRKAGRLARVLKDGKSYLGKPVYAVYVRVK